MSPARRGYRRETILTVKEAYLKQNVLVEPLFNQWYAWMGLIAPATAALYIANSHLKIMQSFVSAPQIHISALRNPHMRGGPFISLDASAVDCIKALMEKTRKEQAHMLKLAEDIKTLEGMLENEATGHSLESLYDAVPEGLKGYVELVYDLNNHPSIRLIEGLLYKSPYYNESSQSVALSTVDDDYRPFVFSTPRLKSEDRVHLDTPFACSALDELFRMKFKARPIESIKEALNLNGDSGGLFSAFFTNTPPARPPVYEGDLVRVRYFGHATLLVEYRGLSLLTDPVISYDHGKGIDRYTYADLPDYIDYVLITHTHQDHCMLETLLQLRHKIRNLIVPKSNSGTVIDPSIKLALKQMGFSNVLEIDEMEALKIEGGTITGLPFIGEHADLSIRTKIAYLINLSGRSMLCAADSNNIEPIMYRHIHESTGDIDAIFLGMECDGAPMSWIYGSLLTKSLTRKQDQSRRLNGSDYERAISLVEELKPKSVYVYAMGQEPWLAFVTSIGYTEESRPIVESDRLVEECKSRGIESERLFGQKEIFLPSF